MVHRSKCFTKNSQIVGLPSLATGGGMMMGNTTNNNQMPLSQSTQMGGGFNRSPAMDSMLAEFNFCY